MIILICGVHGVGKTFLCESIHVRYGIKYYTASELIKTIGKVEYLKTKHVESQSLNEKYLITAIKKIKASRETDNYIVDGHLCLLDYRGRVSRLKLETIKAIMPDYIIVLTEKTEIIALRRLQRDGVNQSESDIQTLQSEEIIYAREISTQLNIPILVLSGMEDFEKNCETITKLFSISHK